MSPVWSLCSVIAFAAAGNVELKGPCSLSWGQMSCEQAAFLLFEGPSLCDLVYNGKRMLYHVL